MTCCGGKGFWLEKCICVNVKMAMWKFNKDHISPPPSEFQ